MKYQLEQSDIYAFASSMNIAVKQKGNEIKFQRCPYCQSSRQDQWTFSINAVTGAYCCPRASCSAKGHFVELSRDFDFQLESITPKQYKELPRVRLFTSSPAEEYLFRRGIRKEVIRAYGITTNPKDPNQLIFPFYRKTKDADGQVYERMEFVKYRLIDYDRNKHKAKEWCENGCKPILFGMDHCDPCKSRTLVITEGQIDSLSLTSAGIPNAVSVPNGARGFTWVEHCRDFVTQFDTIVVFGDCERGSITLVDEMREMFPGAKIRTPRLKDYLGEKDANDILQSFGERALRTAVEKAESFKPSTIREMADVEQVNLDDVPHFRTLFPKLDQALGGFYEGQLITLTGKRGTGKSTFASMFAVAALWQQWNVLFYSGEMTDYEVKRWIDFQIAGEKAIQERVYTSSSGYYLDSAQEKQLSDWYRHRLFLVDNAILEEQEKADIISEIEIAVRTYGIRFVIIDNLMTAIDAGENIYMPDDDREWTLKTRQKREVDPFDVVMCEQCFYIFPKYTKEGKRAACCPKCLTPLQKQVGDAPQKSDLEPEENAAAKLEKVTEVHIVPAMPSQCRTLGDLAAYGKAKGYKPGWAYYMAKRMGLM